MHLPDLLRDLTLILLVAGLVSIVFHWLKQPVVLGYLLVGILLGPHVTFTPNIIDTVNVKVWADLGLILLLFLLGLEFNFKKLFRVGKSAFVAATFEIILMIGIGYFFGKIFGWDNVSSIFLGCILSISSTAIIIKSLDDLKLKSKKFSKLVFGILIIEDLLAILILVILTTLISGQGTSLQNQMGYLLLLLFVIIPLGLWLTPKFFSTIGPIINDEIKVIVGLGFCLSLVMITSFLGFSPSLGAFLMGAFLGESEEGSKYLKSLIPIRDLFGAIFFTSIGMLVDVNIMISEIWTVLLLCAVTIFAKIFFTSSGAYLSGQDKITSIQVGLSMGQIGEFSFIIAGLGLSMNAIREDLYPITVAVAVLTTFTTPYLIKIANKIDSGNS